MNQPTPNNRKPNKTIEDLIDFIESAAKGFTNSPTFKEQYHNGSDEDHLTEILLNMKKNIYLWLNQNKKIEEKLTLE